MGYKFWQVCFIPNIDAVSNLDKSVSAPVKKAAGLLKDFLGENTSEEADRHSIKQHEQSQHCQRQSVHTDAEEAYPLFAYILSCFTLVSLGFAALLNEIFRVRVRIENDREVSKQATISFPFLADNDMKLFLYGMTLAFLYFKTVQLQVQDDCDMPEPSLLL